MPCLLSNMPMLSLATCPDVGANSWSTVCGQWSLCTLEAFPLCPPQGSSHCAAQQPLPRGFLLQLLEPPCLWCGCFPGDSPALPANVCSLHTSFIALPHSRPGCHPPPGRGLQPHGLLFPGLSPFSTHKNVLRWPLSTKLFINELHKPPLCSQNVSTILCLNANLNISTCSNICTCLPCLRQPQCPHGIQCL